MPQFSPQTTQGPTWLAELIYAPGTEVRATMAVVAVCVVGFVGWKLWRTGVPDTDIQQQMGSILATAVAKATGTIVAASIGPWGYVLDVGVGVVAGAAVVIVGESAGRRVFRNWVHERRAPTAWLTLASLLWTPLAIVPPGGRASLLGSIVWGGLAVAVGMAVLTGHEDFSNSRHDR
jgi:hypothetical protein